MSGDEAASRATIRAKASDEYASWQQARDEAGVCLEHVRSLKRFLQHQSDEMRLAR
jgi:tRNA U34 2-thiouridine synthase MnmA/TrmU